MSSTSSATLPPPSSERLRWSLTLQAFLGALGLAGLAAAALALDVYAIGAITAPILREQPLWAAVRLALLVPATAAAAMILRWLWSPAPPPRGIPISPPDAPDFHRQIERFSSRFGINRRIEVRITGEMNASIVNRPRSIALQIGLPLMLSVTAKQCTAILAHEFGHMRVQRRGPGAWTSHLRAWWHRVLAAIDTDPSWFGRLAALALRSADRRYLTDSLRLSHLDEFEADSWAAQVIGAEPLAGALFSIVTKEKFLMEDYWRKVHAQADYRAHPSILPFQHMASALKAGYDRAEALADYDERVPPGAEEAATHPSIRARCDRLAVDPRRQHKDAAMAAEIYLQSILPRLAHELDLEWWAENGSEWRARHREVRRARQRIARLEKLHPGISTEEKLELAALVENYSVERDPLELYIAVLDDETPCATALLGAGRLLLERNDPEGTAYLLRAMTEDSEVGLSAAAHLLGFADANAVDWLRQRAAARAGELIELSRGVREEGETDPRGARWESSGLDSMTRRKLAKVVGAVPTIRRCYVVRRVSVTAPLWIAYVLVARTDDTDPQLAGRLRELAEAVLPEERPVRVLLVPRGSPWERMARSINAPPLRLGRRRSTGTGWKKTQPPSID